METQNATFAAGCFWGIEATFGRIEGVLETAVGYLGGSTKSPTYEQVCTGQTGHAEVVQLQFDPERVTYAMLLEKFWAMHDPTTLNRQGPDVGSQYRSAIFYHDETQRDAAEKSKQQANDSGNFRDPIVTEITSASEFYRAEEYHQRYLARKGISSCGQ